jgi:hypothetical protein
MTTILCVSAFFVGVAFDAFLQCALAPSENKRNRLAQALVRAQREPIATRLFRGPDGLLHVCMVFDRGGNSDRQWYEALPHSYHTVRGILEAEANVHCHGK